LPHRDRAQQDRVSILESDDRGHAPLERGKGASAQPDLAERQAVGRTHGGELPRKGLAGLEPVLAGELVDGEVHAVVAGRHDEALEGHGNRRRLNGADLKRGCLHDAL
jgi:hypothetical protein